MGVIFLSYKKMGLKKLELKMLPGLCQNCIVQKFKLKMGFWT